MQEDLTLYFGSAADALIVLAVLTISAAALRNGYSVLKKYQQRSYRSSGRSVTGSSFTSWLEIGVAIVLAVHLIKAIVTPSWITLMAAGAVAIIQLVLNCFIARDVESAYLPLKTD